MFGVQIELLQRVKILPAQSGKGIEQFLQRFSPARFKLRETIKWRERARFAVFENDFQAGNPVP